MTSSSSAPASAFLLLDRFFSASSAQDATESLQGMLDGFKTDNKEEDEPIWQAERILQHSDDGVLLVEHLIHLLQHGHLKNRTSVECEDGTALVCKLYQQILSSTVEKDTAKQALLTPSPGRLLEALLDVMDNSQRSVYTRVLALQLLETISKNFSSLASDQWLQAPNGLHRLADLLSWNPDAPDAIMLEAVRDQALIVAQLLAKHAAMAKVFLFAELEVKLLDLCWFAGGGLTKGSSVVLDSLTLIHTLLQHADPSMQDLVWQRPSVAPRLYQLLDLRGGDDFLNPKSSLSRKKKKKRSTDDNDDDDLDSLLQSGTTAKKKEDGKGGEEVVDEVYHPRLLPSEEQVVFKVLGILHLLFDSESLRPGIWKQQIGLCSLVWEMGVMQVRSPPICALPSAKLQQAALEFLSEKINDATTMDRHQGLDRLLALVCTGGEIAETHEEKIGVSQAALSVLRNTLGTSRIHELLLHTLAPPPVEDETAPPPGPTVVQKLWNTVSGNLTVSAPPEGDDSAKAQSDREKQARQRVILISGALGGLAVLMCDEESREMMIRAAPATATMDVMLDALVSEENDIIAWSVLRFMCEWVMQSPLAVQTLLNSTASTHLATLASDSSKPFTPLVYLLLGLCMEPLEKEEDCGGWTRAGILQVMQSIGVSKVTAGMEKLKKKEKVANLPWAVCDLEYRFWSKWYQSAVWMVRRRIVDEMAKAGGGGDSDDDDDDDGDDVNARGIGMPGGANVASSTMGGGKTAPTTPSSSSERASVKSLQKLLAQQAKEIEALRQELDGAETKISSQEQQLDVWKRRTESTPTELDTLLNELTAKNSTLEEKIQQMEKSSQSINAQHLEALQEKDRQIEEQRQEAERLRGSEQEAQEDRDRMEQELQGLSQAYANLEDEFRRNQNQSATSTAGGAPTGEGEGPASQQQSQLQQQQSQGEASEQTADAGSTEMSALRADNARLREEARAADEWMAMAVQQMNRMGAEVGNLQQQVGSLQGELEQERAQSTTAAEAAAGSASEIESNLRKEWDERQAYMQSQLSSAQEELRQMQEQRQVVDGQMATVSRELATEREVSTSLRQQLIATREDHSKVMEKQTAEQNEMKQHIDNLQRQISEQQSQSDPSVGGTESATIAAKDAEIQALTKSLEEARSAGMASHPPPSGDIGLLEEQLKSARKEVEDTRFHSQEEIYKRESTIRELESRLSSGLGSYKVEDIHSRDAEIEELRAANETAQEWMANAVDHHQMLAEQVRSLTEEKTRLIAQLAAAQGQVMTTNIQGGEADPALHQQLQNELVAKTNEIEQLKVSLSARDEEIRKVQEEAIAGEGSKEELQIAKEDGAIISKQLADAQSRVKYLEDQLAENQVHIENEKLVAKNQELTSELNEFKAWADMVQKKIAEMLASKESSDKRMAELSEEVETKTKECQDLARSLEELKKSASQVEVVSNDNDDSDKNNATVEQLQAEISALETSRQTLTGEYDAMKVELAEMNQAYAELQSWTEMAQKQIAENIAAKEIVDRILETEKSLTQSRLEEIETLKAKLAAAEEAAAAAAASNASAPMETSVVKQESGETATEVTMVTETASSAAVTSAADFFGSATPPAAAATPAVERAEQTEASSSIVDSLHEKLREKEEELRVAHEAINNDEKVVQEWEDRVSELESQITELQTQLQDQEKEAANVISQWQDSYSDMETHCQKLEEEISQHQKDNAALEQKVAVLEETEADLNNAKVELDKKIESLESAIEKEMKEVSDTGPSPTVADEGDSKAVEELKQELQSAQEALRRDEEVVEQWEARVAELESTIETLQTELSDQEQTANDVIAQWQETCSTAENRCSELEKELEIANSKVSGDDTGEQKGEADPGTHQQQEDRIRRLEGEVGELREQEKASENTISTLKNTCEEAEEKCKTLTKEVSLLQDEKDSLEKTIETLENDNDELEEFKSSLLEKIEAMEIAAAVNRMPPLEEVPTEGEPVEATGDSQTQISEIQDELRTVRESLAESENTAREAQDRIVALEAEIQEAETRLQEQEDEARAVVNTWQESYSELETEIENLTAEIEKVRQEKTSIEEAWEELGSDKEKLQQEKARLENTVTEYEALAASSVNDEKEQELLSLLRDREKELSDARETIAEDEQVVKQWEDRVRELLINIKNLEKDLRVQEEESTTAITQWQERCTEFEANLSELQNELKMKESQMEEKDEMIEQLYEDISRQKTQAQELESHSASAASLESRVSGYQSEIETLRRELESEKEQRENEVEQLQSLLSEEKEEHAEARDEIKSLTKSVEELRTESEDVVDQWTDRVTELQGAIEDLETQLQQQETEANEAISVWEQKAEELESELEETSGYLAQLKQTLGLTKNEYLMDAVMAIKQAFDATKSQERKLAHTQQKQKEHVSAMEAKLIELSETLQKQKESISKLEKEKGDGEKRLEGLDSDLEGIRSRFDELSAAKDALEKQKEVLEEQRQEKEATIKSLQDRDASRAKDFESMNKKINELVEERDLLKDALASKKREKLEEERDRLTVVIAELEEELREANDMVQAHLTDGSSEKATEVAAQALRDEIEELRNRMDEYRISADDEKAARKTAEAEASRLREDLTALASLGHEKLTPDQLQMLTIKASEKLKKKERTEIEQLRKSLYRAVDELETARKAEKEANERLSKAQLQNSVFEQEVVAAKSETNFLTQAMEEMRLDEESKRASLEYRVGSLEDENDVLRRYNSEELQSVQQELMQVTMEKDRILHQLKESEKTNAALVFAASRGASDDGDSSIDPETELIKLRIENAHLLTIAADEKVRAERRLREMLSSQAAETEADSILEHELRIAAEATIRTLKIEVEELKSRLKGGSTDENIPPTVPIRTENLTKDLDSTKKELQLLTAENAALKAKMDQASVKAKSDIHTLTEELQKAKAKAYKLEREGRYNSAVKSEVARLRLPANPDRKDMSEDGWMIVGNDPSAERTDAALSSSHAFDLIRKQKEEIQEERKMYLEFLSEHEDLLALLAQRDVERSCLKEALTRAGGEKALLAAVREAEERSIAQFGKTVRAS